MQWLFCVFSFGNQTSATAGLSDCLCGSCRIGIEQKQNNLTSLRSYYNFLTKKCLTILTHTLLLILCYSLLCKTQHVVCTNWADIDHDLRIGKIWSWAFKRKCFICIQTKKLTKGTHIEIQNPLRNSFLHFLFFSSKFCGISANFFLVATNE